METRVLKNVGRILAMVSAGIMPVASPGFCPSRETPPNLSTPPLLASAKPIFSSSQAAFPRADSIWSNRLSLASAPASTSPACASSPASRWSLVTCPRETRRWAIASAAHRSPSSAFPAIPSLRLSPFCSSPRRSWPRWPAGLTAARASPSPVSSRTSRPELG